MRSPQQVLGTREPLLPPSRQPSLPAQGCRKCTPSRDLLTGKQPPPGGQTGATRACHWTGSANRAVADLQPLQHPAAPVGHHRGGFLALVEGDLTANHSDSCRSAATSADEHEPSTCRDGRQRTTLDGRGRVRSPQVGKWRPRSDGIGTAVLGRTGAAHDRRITDNPG